MTYLYHFLEEYHESEDENEKDKVFNEFLETVWSSKYQLKKLNKKLTYKIHKDKFSEHKDMLQLFEQYKVIEYKLTKSYHPELFESHDYMKSIINNLYAYFVDPEVYMPANYYHLLKTPKYEYYKVIETLNKGNEVSESAQIIEARILEAFKKAEEIKEQYIEDRKIKMNKKEFNILIEGYMRKLFDNYKIQEVFEEEFGWAHINAVYHEDQRLISYFHDSLKGYLMNYIRDSKPKEKKVKYCLICKQVFDYKNNKQKYCKECKRIGYNNSKREYMRQWRSNLVTK